MKQASKRSDGVFDFFNEVAIVYQLASTLFSQNLPDGVHVSHFAILNHMVRMGDGRTPLQLASALQVTKATMSHSLHILEDRGFIVITPHPDDGRSKIVNLTERGKVFRGQAIAQIEAVLDPLSHTLDLEAMAAALPTLRSVRAILDSHRQDGPT